MFYKLMLTLSVPLFLTSCGAADLSLPTSEGDRNSGDQTMPPKESVTPPIAYYESALAAEFDLVFGKANIAERIDTIYFNLDGGDVQKGFAAGQSFLICDELARIPGAGLDEEARGDVTFYVKNYFKQTYPEINVTFSAPTEGTYTTIFVTTQYSVLGCGDSDLKFHAPFDREGINFGDVGFAFVNASSDLDDLVTQIETAAERTLGIEGQSPLIKSLVTPEEKLESLDTIHSMSRLLWELQDKDVVNITPLHPDLEATVPTGLRHLDGFDRIITVTLGISANQGGTSGTTGGGGGGGLLDWLGGLLGGGSSSGTGTGGSATDLISAVAILSGSPAIAAATQVLGPLLGVTPAGGQAGAGDGSDAANAGQKGSKLPRYDEVLALKGYATLAEMLADMRGHASFINQEYDGQTASSLHSLLVVGYSQAFRKHLEMTSAGHDTPMH